MIKKLLISLLILSGLNLQAQKIAWERTFDIEPNSFVQAMALNNDGEAWLAINYRQARNKWWCTNTHLLRVNKNNGVIPGFYMGKIDVTQIKPLIYDSLYIAGFDSGDPAAEIDQSLAAAILRGSTSLAGTNSFFASDFIYFGGLNPYSGFYRHAYFQGSAFATDGKYFFTLLKQKRLGFTEWFKPDRYKILDMTVSEKSGVYVLCDDSIRFTETDGKLKLLVPNPNYTGLWGGKINYFLARSGDSILLLDDNLKVQTLVLALQPHHQHLEISGTDRGFFIWQSWSSGDSTTFSTYTFDTAASGKLTEFKLHKSFEGPHRLMPFHNGILAGGRYFGQAHIMMILREEPEVQPQRANLAISNFGIGNVRITRLTPPPGRVLFADVDISVSVQRLGNSPVSSGNLTLFTGINGVCKDSVVYRRDNFGWKRDQQNLVDTSLISIRNVRLQASLVQGNPEICAIIRPSGITESDTVDNVFCQTIPFSEMLSQNKLTESAMNIYPNPAQDWIFIEGDIVTIEIYDLSGKALCSLKASVENWFELPRHLQSGIYLIRDADNPSRFARVVLSR